MVGFGTPWIVCETLVSLNNIRLGIAPRGDCMTESITQQIEDPDKREEFSDDLERYVGDAADEISRFVGEIDNINVEEDYFHRVVRDIIMENVFIPIVMGENKTRRTVAADVEK